MTSANKRALVTGCAGFIGSQIVERLSAMGYEVTGIDALRDAYDVEIKKRHLKSLSVLQDFRYIEAALDTMDLREALDGVEAVFHTAGQAGVRSSWGQQFQDYIRDNIHATQRMLEACVGHPDLKRFVFSSSSSVYGNAEELPVTERAVPQPISPYGVTKLAAEHLCSLYATTSGVPAISLRYFTVYGPRQRPDMAFHILCKALLTGTPFTVLGDGQQTRDFTYVDDIVEANIRAMQADGVTGVFNVAGGSRVKLLDVIHTLEDVTGKKVNLDMRESSRGDARHTWADASRAREVLGYAPSVELREGLAAEYEYMAGLYG